MPIDPGFSLVEYSGRPIRERLSLDLGYGHQMQRVSSSFINAWLARPSRSAISVSRSVDRYIQYEDSQRCSMHVGRSRPWLGPPYVPGGPSPATSGSKAC